MNVKKKKKWNRRILQIALACLLICCVVQWMPEKTFASSFVSMDVSKLDDNGNVIVTDGYNEHSVYQTQLIGISNYKTFVLYRPYIKEKNNFVYLMYVVTADNGSFKGTCCDDNGKTYNFDPAPCGVFNGRDGKKYHVYSLYGFQGGHYKCKSSVTATYNLTDTLCEKYDYKYERIAVEFGKRLYGCCDDDLINNAMCWETGDTDELENEATKGQIDNPIKDEDIGCLVISKKKSSDLSGLGDEGNSGDKENIFRVRFGWKYKTNTDFSLQKNKYAQTFIQVRIQNRSVIYNNLRHTEIKRKLNSYGENALIYNFLPVDHQPLVITLTDVDFLKKYLPNYYSEINTPTNITNALFLGNKYAFQFRVVCTDDLSVIPSGSTGAKWYCGRWTETTVDFDPVTPTDDEQKTGDIGDNGDFVQNEDDTTTKIDDASDKQYDSDDDASDDFNNSSKKDKDGFNWDIFKNLINDCKEVPGFIKSVFSFLPDWVLVFVTLAFGIWAFVLIKRAIV